MRVNSTEIIDYTGALLKQLYSKILLDDTVLKVILSLLRSELAISYDCNDNRHQ